MSSQGGGNHPSLPLQGDTLQVKVSNLAHKAFLRTVAASEACCEALGLPTRRAMGDYGVQALRLLGFGLDPAGVPTLDQNSPLATNTKLQAALQQAQQQHSQLQTRASQVQLQNERIAAELATLRSQTQAQVNQLNQELLQSRQQQQREALQHDHFFQQVHATIASKAAEQATDKMRIDQARAAARARARPAPPRVVRSDPTRPDPPAPATSRLATH